MAFSKMCTAEVKQTANSKAFHSIQMRCIECLLRQLLGKLIFPREIGIGAQLEDSADFLLDIAGQVGRLASLMKIGGRFTKLPAAVGSDTALLADFCQPFE